MNENTERVNVPISPELNDWLEREAAKLDRPKAYVVRGLIAEAAARVEKTQPAE